jgi:NifB/MoaA-like Fe-S oxidoreductase
MVGVPVFVTSVSGIYAIKPILDEVNRQGRACVVKNYVFGEEVTVTGLLTWEDIRMQVVLGEDEYIVFSSGIFNADMKTLDDVHVSEIQREVGKAVLVVDELFCEWKEY